jgi:alpha-1,3-rhamnosyl/mannosyltransferase
VLVTGNPTAEFRRLAAEAEEVGRGHFHFLGFVSEEELIALYNRASAFVFPSRYEGFGLPILEAMACGCPVICSNTTSLPEVAGDAALLIDPQDPVALAEAIATILTDQERRTRLGLAGIQRAGAFTWTRTAEQTLAVYREVCYNLSV